MPEYYGEIECLILKMTHGLQKYVQLRLFRVPVWEAEPVRLQTIQLNQNSLLIRCRNILLHMLLLTCSALL